MILMLFLLSNESLSLNEESDTSKLLFNLSFNMSWSFKLYFKIPFLLTFTFETVFYRVDSLLFLTKDTILSLVLQLKQMLFELKVPGEFQLLLISIDTFYDLLLSKLCLYLSIDAFRSELIFNIH
jgi:hypothetical protein